MADAAALGRMSIFTNKTCDVEQEASLAIGQGNESFDNPWIAMRRRGRKEKNRIFSQRRSSWGGNETLRGKSCSWIRRDSSGKINEAGFEVTSYNRYNDHRLPGFHRSKKT